MASNGQAVASYWASIGVKVDNKELLKVDKLLKDIETRFSKFSLTNPIRFSRFAVNQAALQRTLGDALDFASRRVTFNIDRFTVNERSLRSSLMGAFARSNVSAPVGMGQRESRVAGRTAAGGIGAYALASRAFLPVAALAAGGYGLSNLNQRNQQVVAAQLQTQAVVQQAGGTAAQGDAAFGWLRGQANRIGFNYLDAVGDFNKLTSGLTGAGMSVAQSQRVYKGFAELSRTNKLDRVAQQRVFRALSQVAGKGKLQAEELTGQLAESLPGAVALFAQAYQRQTGGSLTGQASIAALQQAMKKGQVNSGILTFAGDLASDRANAGGALNSASQASQAQQARFQNALNDLARVASNSGVEEGFARIFKTLNDGLTTAGPLVERLASGFNEATKAFRILALIPQSFNRMLDGKESFIGTLIGPEESAQFIENINQLNGAWTSLKSNLGDVSWADYLKTTLQEVNVLLSGISSVAQSGAGLYNIINNIGGDKGIFSKLANDQDLSGLDRLKLINDSFSQSSGQMSLDDWDKKIADYKATRDRRNGPDYDYSQDAQGGSDIPVVPAQMMSNAAQTVNSTVNLNFGDINITGSGIGSESGGFAGDIQSQLSNMMQDAWTQANLNYAKSGR